jgi:glutaredoxin-related protein
MFSPRLLGLCKGGLITQKLRLLATATGISNNDLDRMVKSGTKVVVFMKGTPEAPKCGFSNAVVQILKMHGVDKYDSYNVLADESLRQGEYLQTSGAYDTKCVCGQVYAIKQLDNRQISWLQTNQEADRMQLEYLTSSNELQ